MKMKKPDALAATLRFRAYVETYGIPVFDGLRTEHRIEGSYLPSLAQLLADSSALLARRREEGKIQKRQQAYRDG